MYRVILILMIVSMLNGLLIGLHFTHVMRQQALKELSLKVDIRNKGIEDIEFLPPEHWHKSSAFSNPILQSLKRSLDPLFDKYVQLCMHNLFRGNEIRLKKIDVVELANEAEISNRYQNFVDAQISCTYRGMYREAAKYSKYAWLLRPYSFVHSSKKQDDFLNRLSRFGFIESDVVYSESLMALGEYQHALDVMISMPPLNKTDASFCAERFIPYRQNTLGAAYLSLGRYGDAIKTLKKPIPNLSKDNSTWIGISLSLAMAYLCSSNEEAAFAEIADLEKMLGAFQLTTPIKEIPGANDQQAIAISRNLVDYLSPHPDDITAAPLLDQFSHIMLTYKHKEAAIMLSNAAKVLRSN